MNSSISINANLLSEELLKWWTKNQRKFPWRNTRDPYKILISEILLHRTRAEQVVPIYCEFIVKFPTIKHLSIAGLDDIKKLLYPLGLHWRTKLLHNMAIVITKKYGKRISSARKELESLPGVGHYIASAVRCFAFGYPEPLLDTNTVRILGRMFGIRITDGSRRSRCFQKLSQSILDRKKSREFNYAMIDLGAIICKPKEPLCKVCPLNRMCKLGLNLTKA